jgi:hypothetical protein
MSKTRKELFRGKLAQYGLVGGALGLYYGIFYQPGSEPDIAMAFMLSAFAALLTVIVRSWRKGFPFRKLAIDFITIFFFFAIFMLSITLRKTAYDLGGQPLVIAETLISGIALGLLLAWTQFGGQLKE